MGEKKGYVKLWLSYETYFAAYTPEQVGNLTLAMLAYKNAGTEPEFYGTERFIWPAIRRDIDESRAAQEAAAEQHRACGRLGGRKRTDPSPENQIGSGETNLPPWTKDKDIDMDYGHGQGEGQGEGPAWAREKMASADRLLAQLMREAREEAAEAAEAGDVV
jgi:hypothetical protein